MWCRTITVRKTKAGEKRYAVRFRLGGRAYPVAHGGSFGTMKEARARRDFIAGELAAGRNPSEALRAARGEPTRTLAYIYDAWLASRLDVSEGTRQNFASQWKRLEPRFGLRAPERLTHTDVQAWVSEQAAELEPGALRAYLGTLRQLLDFAGIDPNPVRDRRLRLPSAEREVPTPPSDKHVLAITTRRGSGASCSPSLSRRAPAWAKRSAGRGATSTPTPAASSAARRS